MKQYGYHCTEANPDTIMRDGFKSGRGGFTRINLLEDFYEKYLPKNPMFLSDLHAKVWSTYSKYCMKIDVTGLQLYPDFGHLLDYHAYYDEDCFYWRENGLEWLRADSRRDQTTKKVLDFVESLDDNTLWASDFTGEMSREILGTFVIDGNLLTPSRIVQLKASNHQR